MDAEAGVDTNDRIEVVYREQGERLWRSLVLSFGDRELASDAVAEAFAQLLARGDAVRDPAAWVWRSAFRICAGAMQDQRRVVPVPLEEPPRSNDDLLVVLEALGQLPERLRTAVVLADYAGYPHRVIGEMLGASSGTVAVRVHRGRRRLRELLEVDDD